MTSPSRPRSASFATAARSSAFTWIAGGLGVAAAVVATSATVGCGSDSGYYQSGLYGYGDDTSDASVYPLGPDASADDGGDGSTTGHLGDGGALGDGGDAGDGSTGVACTGFASCGSGQACNGGFCSACGGESGPCPCTTTTQCGTGLECVDNACSPTASVCHYQTDCASGDVCDDGQCVASCTTSCATGTCTKGACVPPASTGSACSDDTTCAGTASPFCVDGHCAPACGGDAGSCATGFTCNQGACVTATGPAVECTRSSDCTAAGQTCVDNLCKFLCTTSTDCTSHDSRFPACAADGVCRTAVEAAAACKSKSDCQQPDGSTALDCIDNVCQ
jgi:hypothetical protein